MPLAPQITITPVTVTSSNMTVTSVIAGGEPATTETVTAVQTTADNAWSAVLGKNTVFYQTTAPSTTGRVAGDVWFDTDDGNKMYGFNGTSWVAYQFGTASFANASVELAKLADGSVNAAKLLDGAVISGKIAASAVGTTELAANSIVAGKIAASTITGDKIAAGTITATNIAAGTITTDKLTAGTLTGFTINNGSGTFEVTSGGVVTASSGTIGGFTLSSSSLTATNLGLYNSSSNSITAQGSIVSNSEVRSPSFIGNNNVTLEATNDLYLKCGASYNTYGNSQMYNNSITGRTLLIQGSGTYTLATSSSTRRDKQDIEPSDLDVSELYTLPVQKFRYKREVESEGEAAPFHHGLMAEDVAEAGGLEWLIDRDEEGQPSYIYWSERGPQALLKMIQELHARVTELEAQVANLTA